MSEQEQCNHQCGSCSHDCAERESLIAKTHELSRIKKVIGVVSGKGGVGKSMVTSLLSVLSQRHGYKTGILDADITGPSIPRAFGLREKAGQNALGLYPVQSRMGTAIMSLNLLLPNDTDPVVWRGPIIASTVKQFWTDVIWGDIDFMFVDMPPGTGDVPLTVFQSLPLDGIVIVATPQELVGMIVEKAINMASLMNVPVLGLVENMSYLQCPDCGKHINVFGESRIQEIADRHSITNVARLPIDPALASSCDNGTVELFKGEWLNEFFEKITQDKTSQN